MGFLKKDLKIGEGQKYDITKVSTDGVTKDEAIKNKIKLLDIFKAFDIDKDGTLNTIELAKAMDCFGKLDADGDKKLSNDELKKIADAINNSNTLNGKNAVKANDIRDFIKNIVNAQAGDTDKVSAQGVLNELQVQQLHAAASVQEIDTPEINLPQPEIDLQPINNEPKTFSYTVQNGESYNGLIKRMLKEQGIENPTKEQIQELKDQFNKLNPGMVRKASNGVEFLPVGAKVKLPVDLGDKNNAADQVKAFADDEAARKQRAEEIARKDTISFQNEDYNTFEDLAKALFAREGITPTKQELDARIKELKEDNKNLQDGELKGKAINAKVTEEFSQRLERKEADARERAEYKKKAERADVLAEKLFYIADNSNAVSNKEFFDTMKEVNKTNIVEVLNAYDRKEGEHQGDTSLMDTICSEIGFGHNKKILLKQIINNLYDAAIDAGVSQKEAEQLKKAYLDSMNEQFNSAHSVNTLDMEVAVDALRGAIEAKRQGKDIAEISTADAMNAFSESYMGVDEAAQKEYSDARAKEGWTAKTGDWVCGLFGCNTIDEMDAKLGDNAKAAKDLLTAAQGGDEASFKRIYKDLFGVDFDEKKIAAQQVAEQNYAQAYVQSETIKLIDELMVEPEVDFSALTSKMKEKFECDDDAINSIIANYADKYAMKSETDDDKKNVLLRFLKEQKTNAQEAYDSATKGRSLEQMGKDLDLITKSAYGTNDISKEVTQFNANQETTEMVTTVAAEIGATVILSAVPGLGQMAAAKLAVSAAKWGTKGVKFAKYAATAAKGLDKTAKGLDKFNKARTATTKAAFINNAVTTGTATAAVNITDGKSAEEVVKRTLMNMSFAGIGTASSTVAPKMGAAIAQKLGVSQQLATEAVQEALNAAGAAGLISATGGDFTTNDAAITFVTGMVIARLSRGKAPQKIDGNNTYKPVVEPKLNERGTWDVKFPGQPTRTFSNEIDAKRFIVKQNGLLPTKPDPTPVGVKPGEGETYVNSHEIHVTNPPKDALDVVPEGNTISWGAATQNKQSSSAPKTSTVKPNDMPLTRATGDNTTVPGGSLNNENMQGARVETRQVAQNGTPKEVAVHQEKINKLGAVDRKQARELTHIQSDEVLFVQIGKQRIDIATASKDDLINARKAVSRYADGTRNKEGLLKAIDERLAALNKPVQSAANVPVTSATPQAASATPTLSRINKHGNHGLGGKKVKDVTAEVTNAANSATTIEQLNELKTRVANHIANKDFAKKLNAIIDEKAAALSKPVVAPKPKAEPVVEQLATSGSPARSTQVVEEINQSISQQAKTILEGKKGVLSPHSAATLDDYLVNQLKTADEIEAFMASLKNRVGMNEKGQMHVYQVNGKDHAAALMQKAEQKLAQVKAQGSGYQSANNVLDAALASGKGLSSDEINAIRAFASKSNSVEELQTLVTKMKSSKAIKGFGGSKKLIHELEQKIKELKA